MRGGKLGEKWVGKKRVCKWVGEYGYIHIYMGEKKWVKNGWNWGG
jgi:hypothetical protein